MCRSYINNILSVLIATMFVKGKKFAPVKDLSQLSASQLKCFINSFDHVLCDCDGVVFNLNTPVEGVKESLKMLRELGKEVRFVSNNSAYGLDTFQKLLNSFGCKTKKEDIVIPVLAIVSYLKQINFDKHINVLGTSFMKKELTDAGFTVSSDGPDVVSETIDALKENTEDDPNIGAVVVDMDLNMNYIKLMRASVHLSRPEVLFITGANDSTVANDPVPLIGPKFIQDMLKEVTRREPTAFGKPSTNIQKFITDKYEIQEPSRVLFIGDSFNDMVFAEACGYQKLLVFTGLAKPEDVKGLTDAKSRPDFVVKSLGDLHVLLNNTNCINQCSF